MGCWALCNGDIQVDVHKQRAGMLKNFTLIVRLKKKNILRCWWEPTYFRSNQSITF